MNTSNLIGCVGKFNVLFREDCFSSHAGMLLVKDFADELGVRELLNQESQVKQRQRGYNEADAVLGLVYNTVIGGDCLLDLEVLRGDPGTKKLIDMESIIAPTTAGEHLRKFDIGDIHDLQRVNQLLQQRVRPKQQSEACTLDIDSSIYEQSSSNKEGSTKAYNAEVGYHPLLAFWDETEGSQINKLRDWSINQIGWSHSIQPIFRPLFSLFGWACRRFSTSSLFAKLSCLWMRPLQDTALFSRLKRACLL